MVAPSNKRLLLESDKAAPNGLATLGADSKIPDAQLNRGVANGLATLDAGGTVPASQIHANMKLWINVKDYGAVGNWNGTTGADDTAAIQAAVNAAPSGATIWFPPTSSATSYRMTGQVTVTTPNLRFLSGGRAYATQIKCTTAGVLMFAIKTNGFITDGITYVGDGGLNGAGATVNGFEMFGDVDGNVDSTFKGETCLINLATAIRTHGRNLVVEDDVTITSSLRGVLIDGKDAVYHTGPNADQNRGHYIGGRYHNIGVDNTTAAIEVLPAAKMLHCTITPRHIDSNGFAKHIVLTGTATDPCKGVTIKPAKFTECAADVITGTYLWNSVIEMPHIVGDTTSTTYGTGIVLANANNVDVIEPTILQIGNHGIKLTNSTGVRIRSPRIKVTGVNPTGGPYDGINADSTNSGIHITGPFVESATGYAVNGSPLTSSLEGGKGLSNTLGFLNSNTLNNFAAVGQNTRVEGKFGVLEDTGRQWYSLTANTAFRLAIVTVDVSNVAYQLKVEVTGLDDSTPDCYLFAVRYVKNNGGAPIFVPIGTDAASAGMSLSLSMFSTTGISVNVTSTVNARIGAVVKAVSGGGTSGTAKRGVNVAMT